MNDRDLAPLDADLRALLKRGSRVEPARAEAKARVLARVEAASAAPSHGGSAGGSIGDGPATRTTLARRVFPWVAGFTLGMAAGALAARTMVPASPAEPTSPMIYVDRNPIVVRTPPWIAGPAAAVPTAQRQANPVAVPLGSGSNRAALSDVAGERAMLDVARGALEREDGVATLVATTQHEHKYPNGILVQEREAMAIRALAMLGRMGEARKREQNFRTTFPASALLPTLEAIIGRTPEQ